MQVRESRDRSHEQRKDMKSTVPLHLLVLLPLAGACAAPAAEENGGHAADATEKLEPRTCGSIQRVHTLGGVYLASQPSAADFEQAKQGGIRTVIDLRHTGEVKDFDERAVVEGLGLAYVQLPWNGVEQLTDEVFDRARELLRTAERPILLHCGSANRVGAVWLPHRVLDGGLSYEAALAEARTIGLKTPEYEARAREYVARRTAGE
jgi:uncharacterized protein (TIGR01244 family)